MHSSIRSYLCFGLFLGLLHISGCAATNTVMGTRLAEDPYHLDIFGPLEVDVRSFNGDVFITADEFHEGVTVRVVRDAAHGAGRYEEARASLPQISYSVRIVAGEIGPRLQVRTFTDHPEPHFQRAHLHITLQEADGVFVRTTNGKVHARGVQGRVDITTTNGDVRVMSNYPMRQAVTIVNHRGNIDYRVRGESTGLIDGETVRGRVIHRARQGRMIVNNGTNQSRLHAQLNGGENPINLRTTDGDIRIAVVRNPEEVGTLIFE